MNCYNHPETANVAICIDCSKGLCKECSDFYSMPICSGCNRNRVGKEKNEIIKIFLTSMLIGFIGTYIMSRSIPQNIDFFIVSRMLFTFYLFASIPIGWSVLNKLTSKYFLILPIVGWLFYFVIKLALAYAVGIFISPYKWFKLFKRYRQLIAIKA